MNLIWEAARKFRVADTILRTSFFVSLSIRYLIPTSLSFGNWLYLLRDFCQTRRSSNVQIWNLWRQKQWSHWWVLALAHMDIALRLTKNSLISNVAIATPTTRANVRLEIRKRFIAWMPSKSFGRQCTEPTPAHRRCKHLPDRLGLCCCRDQLLPRTGRRVLCT